MSLLALGPLNVGTGATQRGHSPPLAGSSSPKQAWCASVWLLSELWASRRGACLPKGRPVTSPTDAAVPGTVAPEALKAPFRAALLLAREQGCPWGSGTALHLPWCALGSSPLLVPGLGSPQRDSGHSVPGGPGSIHAPVQSPDVDVQPGKPTSFFPPLQLPQAVA